MSYCADVDRILNSKAYARYVDKTQVVYLVDNDHISHRNLHVQLVSHFARVIARDLGLNCDLVEAIALGHDVGHPPFGHEGESYLSELSLEFGNGAFSHPVQSCRLLSLIEPLNLELAVYDGFLCHDGAMQEGCLRPDLDKGWDRHLEEKERKRLNPDTPLIPATLEGCLVRLSDTISYVARDIEDAVHLGLVSREELPVTFLGKKRHEILSRFAADIVEQSRGKACIACSEEAFSALRQLRDFNFERIYRHPTLKVESQKVQQSYRILFQTLLSDWTSNGKGSHLWHHFLQNKSTNYLEESGPVQLVVDYLSGMTDSFFIKTLHALVVPLPIELRQC